MIEFTIPIKIKATIKPKKSGLRLVGMGGYTSIEDENDNRVMEAWPQRNGSRVYVEESMSKHYDNIEIHLEFGDKFIPNGIPEAIENKLKSAEQEISEMVAKFLEKEEKKSLMSEIEKELEE